MVVYFIQAGEGGRIKIGRTSSIRRRLTKMQTDAPCLLRLLGFSPRLVEAVLHRRFDAYRVARTEWFEPAPEIVEFAASLDGVLSDLVSVYDVRKGACYCGVPVIEIAEAINVGVQIVHSWVRNDRGPGWERMRLMVDAFPGRITAQAILDHHCPPGSTTRVAPAGIKRRRAAVRPLPPLSRRAPDGCAATTISKV